MRYDMISDIEGKLDTDRKWSAIRKKYTTVK